MTVEFGSADAGAGMQTDRQAEAMSGTTDNQAAPAGNGDWAAALSDGETAAPENVDGQEAGAKKADGFPAETNDDGLLPQKPGELGKKPDAPAKKEGEAGAGEGGDKKDAGGDGAPLELVVPDGFQANAERMENFKKLAAELKLDKTGAQKLFDLYHSEMDKGQVESAQHTQKAIMDIRERLDREGNAAIHSDPELGGATFEASANYVQKALRHFFPDAQEYKALTKFYDDANLRNNPLLFKAWARVGKYISEAEAMPSSASGKKENTFAKDWYPDISGK